MTECEICGEKTSAPKRCGCGKETCEECGRTTRAEQRGLIGRAEIWECAECEFGEGGNRG